MTSSTATFQVPSFATPNHGPQIGLTELPDEVIAKCYTELSATDLVTLESVSKRLRTLIATDASCWKRCVLNRWEASRVGNINLLPMAAVLAGGWKQFYAERAASDTKHAPWLVVSNSEIAAIVYLIAGPFYLPPPPSFSIHFQAFYSHQHLTLASLCPTSSIKDRSSSSINSNNNILASSPVTVMATPPSLSVVVLIDASSSVTKEDFSCMKYFTTTLVSTLRAASANAYISIIQFNQHPRVELNLTAVSKPKVSAALDSMVQLSGSTDIAAPIRRARQVLLEEAPPGDRVIVLLTDGQTHAEELVESQNEARRAAEDFAATVYTLGIGRDVDESGLTRIAKSSPHGAHFTLRRFYHGK